MKIVMERSMPSELLDAFSRYMLIENVCTKILGHSEESGSLAHAWIVLPDFNKTFSDLDIEDLFCMFSEFSKVYKHVNIQSVYANPTAYVFKHPNLHNNYYVFFGENSYNIIKSISKAACKCVEKTLDECSK